MDFYHFFSFSAKKAIYRASEVCAQFKCQYLEPEHILYSILNLRSCSAVQVLAQLGVNVPKLTYSVEAYLYENAGSFEGTASFSARTLTLLDNSFKEVKRLNHREIGTNHLMLAMSKEPGNFLRELFTEHQLDAKQIRDTYMKHLKGFDHPAGSPGADAPPTVDIRENQMLESALRELLWLADYLAQRLQHSEAGPLHVMYAFTTRPGALQTIEDAWGLGALKPSAVLAALTRELDRLPLDGAGDEPVMGADVVAVLTEAFVATFRARESCIRYELFCEKFLKQFEQRFAPLLRECELPESERPSDIAGQSAEIPPVIGDALPEAPETGPAPDEENGAGEEE